MPFPNHPLLNVDFKATSQVLKAIVRDMPDALKIGINDLAFQVQRAENAAMSTVFIHPRPFTARSVQVNKADSSTLSAEVFVRQEVAKYLQPYETGGLHVLPGQALLDPIKGNIPLDQYGQLTNLTMSRLKGRQDIFIGSIITRKAGRVAGVWQRLAITRTGRTKVGKNLRKAMRGATLYSAVHGQLKLLIRFGDALPVNKALDFNVRGVALVMAQAPAAFRKALTRAMRGNP